MMFCAASSIHSASVRHRHSVSHLQLMILQMNEEARFGPCSHSLVDKKKVGPGFMQDCRENQCCDRGNREAALQK